MQGLTAMTVAKAAEELGVSESLVRRWIREKRLPAKQYGQRLYLVSSKAIEEFKKLDRRHGVRTELPKRILARLT